MKNYDNISDPADYWLAKYTYENLNKWPSQETIDVLKHRYPYDGGVIYRGMNFDTKEQWDEFLATVVDGKITFGGITSWGKNEEHVEQFAVTKPSYSLNLATMMAYSDAEKHGERISGYCGVILTCKVPPGIGIDVDKSDLGHESEVILPKGTYKVSVRQLKKYRDTEYTDSDIENIILKANKQDINRAFDEKGVINYIFKMMKDRLTVRAQRHLFNIMYPEGEPFKYEFEPEQELLKGWRHESKFHIWLPRLLFWFCEVGIINDPQVVAKVHSLGRKILRLATPIVKEFLPKAEKSNVEALMYVAKICGEQSFISNTIGKIMREKYNAESLNGRKINSIADPKEKRLAMDLHIERMKNILSILGR